MSCSGGGERRRWGRPGSVEKIICGGGGGGGGGASVVVVVVEDRTIPIKVIGCYFFLNVILTHIHEVKIQCFFLLNY